jgi:DNA-binding IclR family transcriptional regulator
MDQIAGNDDGRYIVPALRRGLDILEMFSGAREVVTVPEITRALGISRATAFRLVHTLAVAGYLERLPSAHAFRLGRQSLSLSFEYLHSLGMVDVARPLLEELRDKTGATTHLAIRHGTTMLYLLRAPSRHELVGSSVAPVGTRYPVHAVACGRALLFDLSDAELDELFCNFDFGSCPSPAPQSLAALKAQLAKERRKGYVSCMSAFVRSKRSVGAPIRDCSGLAIASINVSDAASIVKDPDGVAKDEVLATAAIISARLGYQSYRTAGYSATPSAEPPTGVKPRQQTGRRTAVSAPKHDDTERTVQSV